MKRSRNRFGGPLGFGADHPPARKMAVDIHPGKAVDQRPAGDQDLLEVGVTKLAGGEGKMPCPRFNEVCREGMLKRQVPSSFLRRRPALTAPCSARCQSIFSGNGSVTIAAGPTYRKPRHLADIRRHRRFFAEIRRIRSSGAANAIQDTVYAMRGVLSRHPAQHVPRTHCSLRTLSAFSSTGARL